MSHFIDYNTQKLCDIWPDDSSFLADYAFWVPKLAGAYAPLTATRQTQLYYLLYARYGNSPLAYMDVNQFKAALFSIVFQYGGAWEKRLDIQAKLQALELEQGENGSELFDGTLAVYNHALNPASDPSTGSVDELTYINDQNTQRFKYSKLDAYRRLWELLRSDVSEEFLGRFRKLFSKFAGNRRPLIYITEDEE